MLILFCVGYELPFLTPIQDKRIWERKPPFSMGVENGWFSSQIKGTDLETEPLKMRHTPRSKLFSPWPNKPPFWKPTFLNVCMWPPLWIGSVHGSVMIQEQTPYIRMFNIYWTTSSKFINPFTLDIEEQFETTHVFDQGINKHTLLIIATIE